MERETVKMEEERRSSRAKEGEANKQEKRRGHWTGEDEEERRRWGTRGGVRRRGIRQKRGVERASECEGREEGPLLRGACARASGWGNTTRPLSTRTATATQNKTAKPNGLLATLVSGGARDARARSAPAPWASAARAREGGGAGREEVSRGRRGGERGGRK